MIASRSHFTFENSLDPAQAKRHWVLCFQPIYTECYFLPLSFRRICFRFKGCWVVQFISNLNRKFGKQTVSVSGDPDQMPRFAASDLGLYNLPMSHKKKPGFPGGVCAPLLP